ncbi:TRAP transporter substrate-binding protein [Mesorhizobium sp. 1B3]|uniref:TRAP transporter substrate-binding protein n=1 Tax=Mesorhizobium sp. 1B3 TaxID=3243599 RepID=UPI003D9876F8
MKFMKVKGICVGLAIALAPVAAQAQDPIEVRISFNQAETSPAWKEAIKVFGDELESESDGRFKVTHYPGEVLHTVGDGFRATATGITDVTSAWPVYSANSFHLFHATELPLALPNSDVAAARVVDELYPKYLKDEYERMGILLAFNAVTPQYDILTTKPVKSIDDLKGLKIRAAGGGITEIVQRLGAIPVTMTITDAYTAFQQGVVDGIILSTADMVAYRMHEVGKYNYRIGVVRVAIPHAVNRKFYEGLPDDLKQVFAKAATNATYNYEMMYTRLTERALETMRSEGVEVTEASETDLAKVNELVAPMWEAFVKANAGREGASAEELVADIRALTEKYSAMSDEQILQVKDSEPVEGLR